MQAVRTNTGSALGEFCDHYMDGFNTGIIFLIVVRVFGVRNHPLIVLLFCASYLAHTSIMYEQFKTGWLIFEKIGSLEGILLASLTIFASGFEPVYGFLASPRVGGWAPIDLMLAGSALGALVTFLNIHRRVRNASRQFGVYCASVILITVFGVLCLGKRDTQILSIFLLFLLFNVNYIGKLMRGHLVDRIERFPDVVPPVLLLAAMSVVWIFPFRHHHGSLLFPSLIALFVYQGIGIGWIVFSTVYPLRRQWVWWNPKP
jgi:hypothetical protein